AFWEQTIVPVQAAALGVDVYHSPNYILPVTLGRPSVVTIHDLAYLRASLHRRTSHLYLSFLTALALRRASAIIAVSEWTKRALEARYPHTIGRIEVIYQGLDPRVRAPGEDEIRAFRARQAIDFPYVLFVGTIEPRKNLARLVTAFERAVLGAGLPHHLVLIGAPGWKTTDLDQAIARSALRPRIHRLGYVSDGDLPRWYAAADLFVYPSLEEGFGLPPLEAMACGVPVVTSNCSAIPEVVGDAARTVDPRDTTQLASAIGDVLGDRQLASRLIHAGRGQSARFTWREAARQHVALYARVSSGGHR
ncbi:MAG: glycosyltransferase family 4 protein, partial [Candidatus Dormibacteraceae bacterium]